MTAIRAATARSAHALLLRPQPTPTPAETAGAGQAEGAKASTKIETQQPEVGPRVSRVKTAVANRADAQRTGQSATPEISNEPPKPTLDTEVQKALKETYDKFTEGEGGSLAELQRALYDSVWGLFHNAQVKDSPAKAAMALTDFLNTVEGAAPAPPSPTPEITRAADRGIASLATPIVPEGDGTTNPGVSSGGRIQLDLRI